MKIKTLTLAIATATASTYSFAQSAPKTTLLETIYISDSALSSDHLNANYSAETYTTQDITQSGASSLSEFLNTQTSVSIQPSYGNPLAPLLDMNGYGTSVGFENIKIIVDGIALNNIDLAPPQLSSIALSSINSITLVKQRGSVLYGNNASAGVIIIETKKAAAQKYNLRVSSLRGSNNTVQKTLNANQTFDFEEVNLAGQFNYDKLTKGGSKQINSDGTRNSVENENIQGRLALFHDRFDLSIHRDESHSSVNYPGYMTLTEFKANPDANQTSNNNGIDYNTQNTGLKLRVDLPSQSEVTLLLNEHRKDAYYLSGWGSDYKDNTQQLRFKTKFDQAVLNYGFANTHSKRLGSDNTTGRNSFASFIDLTTAIDQWTMTAGLRQESFDYSYQSATQDLQKSEDLQAFNLGASYLFNSQQSIYANYNESFLAPNVDRFFNYGGTFNGFIESQKAKTTTLGFKNKNNTYAATAEAFYIDLDNEIYYNSTTYQNTNIDQSHKYGLNIQLDKSWGQLNTHLNYNFVKAIIDEENSLSSKTLPGVSSHTLTFGADYRFSSSIISALPNHSIQFAQKLTSKTYAMDDFDNSEGTFNGYRSTDVSYRITNQTFSIQAGINNLFDQANGLYLESWAGLVVYPTNYERTFYVKADYAF